MSDVYGHTPVEKMFAGADVYGVGYDPQRAGRPPVRLGLIGAGGVAQSKWLPALWRLRTLWDPVELVAIADPAEDQGRKVARQYGCTWYPDHTELLAAGGVDAVVVASPDHLHAEHARHAVEVGLAVIVEKPFCTSLVDARELCRASEKQRTILMPVANLRFSPPFRRARQAAVEMPGLEGPKVLLGKMHLGYDYVDLLEDATVHLFDLTRFLLGNAIVVSARSVGRPAGRRPYPFGQAAITLEFESGSVAQLFTSSTALSLKQGCTTFASSTSVARGATSAKPSSELKGHPNEAARLSSEQNMSVGENGKATKPGRAAPSATTSGQVRGTA